MSDLIRWDHKVTLYAVRRLIKHLTTPQLEAMAEAAGIDVRDAGSRSAIIDEIVVGMAQWRHDDDGSWLDG